MILIIRHLKKNIATWWPLVMRKHAENLSARRSILNWCGYISVALNHHWPQFCTVFWRHYASDELFSYVTDGKERATAQRVGKSFVYVHYPSEMAKITLQSPTTSGFEAPCLPILTAGTPTCELCLHRKVWCGRWRWLSSHSWHSWWRLFRPVRPRARWGWSGRRRWATWRHTLHRAPGDIGLLRGGGVRANMNRSKERWDFLSPSVISHQMAAWLFFF